MARSASILATPLWACLIACSPTTPITDGGSGGGSVGGGSVGGGSVGGGSVGGGFSGGVGGGITGTGGGGNTPTCGTTPTSVDLTWLSTFSNCQSPAVTGGPFPVTFRLKNPNAERIVTQLGLGVGCERPIQIRTCSGELLRPENLCPADCFLRCEFCSDQTTAIDAGGFVDLQWDGRNTAPTCVCRNLAMPAGRYSARQYFVRADAGSLPDGGLLFRDVDFVLPTDGGPVELNLSL